MNSLYTAFTEEEKNKIIEASNDPDFFNNLVRSIAPNIPGMEDIKSILALQLFCGNRKLLEDRTDISGKINILLFVDPEIDVHSILGSMSRLSPNGVFLPDLGGQATIPFSGRATGNGSGTPSIQSGAVTIADGGLVCYEDLNRLDDIDRSSLHDIVNYGRNIIRSSQSNISLPADTSLLCSISPKSGKIIDGIGVSEQTGLHKCIISLFDLVISIRDMGLKGTLSPAVYTDDFIRRYVAYAKLNCNPKWDEDRIPELLEKEYHFLKRRHDCVIGHHIELLALLAETSARSRLNDTVGEMDVLRGSTVLDNCLNRIDSLYRRE